MRPDYEKLFQGNGGIDTVDRLSQAVLSRISRHSRRTARVKVAVLGFFALAAFLSIIPAVGLMVRGFQQSGFLQYFSLLFSDGRSVMASWQEFVLSLAESLPVVGITAVLGATFVLLASVALVAKHIRTAFTFSRYA